MKIKKGSLKTNPFLLLNFGYIFFAAVSFLVVSTGIGGMAPPGGIGGIIFIMSAISIKLQCSIALPSLNFATSIAPILYESPAFMPIPSVFIFPLYRAYCITYSSSASSFMISVLSSVVIAAILSNSIFRLAKPFTSPFSPA